MSGGAENELVDKLADLLRLLEAVQVANVERLDPDASQGGGKALVAIKPKSWTSSMAGMIPPAQR